jgi:tetratricopeptide (TPR) repeat protein
MEQGDVVIALMEAKRAFELGYGPAESLTEQLRDLLPPEPAEQPPEPKPKRPRRARKPRAKRRDKPKVRIKKEAAEKARPAKGRDRFSEAQAHFRRAMTNRKQGQWDTVVDELQAALRANPGFYNAHIELGKVYARKREWDKAIAEFTDVVRVRPGFATAHFLMGLVYLEQGDWKEAARKFETTLNLDRNHRQAERGLDLARSHLARSAEPEGSSDSDA